MCLKLQSTLCDMYSSVSRAARCTENIGASRFAMYGSGFDSGIPDFGSVRTLHCTFQNNNGGGEK